MENNYLCQCIKQKAGSLCCFKKKKLLMSYKLHTIKFTHLKYINHYCCKPLSFRVVCYTAKLTDINYIWILTVKEKHWIIYEINSCCILKMVKSIRAVIIIIVTICNSQIFVEFLLWVFIVLYLVQLAQ